MSEIFDFLKKTENKYGREPHDSLSAPLVESLELNTAGSVNESAPPEEFPPVAQSGNPDRFDLTEASLQVRNVLDSLTLVGEQFRLLRSKLDLMQKQRGLKTILVTSSVPDEGKTFTASGLAGVFAQEFGKKVLLIDADMRKPKSGWSLGVRESSEGTGLSEVLSGKRDFKSGLLMSVNSPFYFMPAGPLPSNPSELLSSPNLERMLKTAASNFDWVIIDSPPVLALSDTSVIAPLCDAVVLVIRANSTPSKLVLDTVHQIGRDRICGVVLNRQKQVYSSRYYYQYYYRSSKPQK